MEFLVMPQLTGSLIECYSGSDDGCQFNCNCYGDSTCYNMNPCTCNNGNFNCPCYIEHSDCSCFGVYYPGCPSLGCRLRCAVDFGSGATSITPNV